MHGNLEKMFCPCEKNIGIEWLILYIQDKVCMFTASIRLMKSMILILALHVTLTNKKKTM
jgi:hypothetical protein